MLEANVTEDRSNNLCSILKLLLRDSSSMDMDPETEEGEEYRQKPMHSSSLNQSIFLSAVVTENHWEFVARLL